MNRNNITTLDEFKTAHYGKVGTPERDKLESDSAEFRVGVLIHDARLELGLTQEQLADKCGTNKAFISKVENDIHDVRLSTLRKIVEVGLGGELQLSIRV